MTSSCAVALASCQQPACSPCPCGQIKLNKFTCANQLAVYLFVMPSVAKPGTSVTVKVWTCTLSTPSGPWMVVSSLSTGRLSRRPQFELPTLHLKHQGEGATQLIDVSPVDACWRVDCRVSYLSDPVSLLHVLMPVRSWSRIRARSPSRLEPPASTSCWGLASASRASQAASASRSPPWHSWHCRRRPSLSSLLRPLHPAPGKPPATLDL